MTDILKQFRLLWGLAPKGTLKYNKGKDLEAFISKALLSQREFIKEKIEGMRKKTFDYVAKPTISADFTAFGGRKIVAGKSYKATSSLSEEEIIYNQVLDDLLLSLSEEKGGI